MWSCAPCTRRVSRYPPGPVTPGITKSETSKIMCHTCINTQTCSWSRWSVSRWWHSSSRKTVRHEFEVHTQVYTTFLRVISVHPQFSLSQHSSRSRSSLDFIAFLWSFSLSLSYWTNTRVTTSIGRWSLQEWVLQLGDDHYRSGYFNWEMIGTGVWLEEWRTPRPLWSVGTKPVIRRSGGVRERIPQRGSSLRFLSFAGEGGNRHTYNLGLCILGCVAFVGSLLLLSSVRPYGSGNDLPNYGDFDRGSC